MLKLLKRLNRPEIGLITLAISFIALQIWLDLKLPDYMAQITQLTQSMLQTKQGGSSSTVVLDILFAGNRMLLCALGSACCSLAIGYFSAKFSAVFAQDLRRDLFTSVNRFSQAELNHFSIASLITRSTNDVTQVQTLLMFGIQILIKAPLLAFWAIRKIAGKGYEWTLATGISIILLNVFISLILIFVLPKFKKMQNLTDHLNRVTRENLTGIRMIRAYNAEKYQEEKFTEANTELTHTQMFTSQSMALTMPFIGLLLNSLSVAIYFIGAHLINRSSVTNKLPIFADMVVFTNYAAQIFMAFMMMALIFIMLPRASVSAKRIREVLEMPLNLQDGTLSEIATLKKSTQQDRPFIKFSHVSFQYPDACEPILHDIDLEINAGQTVAFIGATGSGKTSIINLLPRFYDVLSGKIEINGLDLRDYKQQDLLQKFGYVSQKAVLFKGSVADNICFGTQRPEEERETAMERALEISQSKEFVSHLDGGLMFTVAQNGTNLSGGQKQRLSIARAIYRQPEIYIFDDSFSALDFKTEKQLRTALRQATQGATTILVAQRISSIMDADQIFVVDQGRIVARGKHRELLQNSQIYKEIALSQLSKEDLERG